MWLELNWIKINYFECFDFDGLDDYWHYGVAFAPLVNAVSYVRQGDQILQSNAHKLCIWMAWRLCVCDNAASTRLNGQIATGTRENGTCMASLLQKYIVNIIEYLDKYVFLRVLTFDFHITLLSRYLHVHHFLQLKSPHLCNC